MSLSSDYHTHFRTFSLIQLVIVSTCTDLNSVGGALSSFGISEGSPQQTLLRTLEFSNQCICLFFTKIDHDFMKDVNVNEKDCESVL